MNVTDEPPNTTMNLHALKTPTAQETLESLCTEISRLKREESALSTKRQSIENAVIDRVSTAMIKMQREAI